MRWSRVCLRAHQRTWSTMASWRPFPRVCDVPEGLDGELGPALLQAVPARWGVQGPALEGCLEDLGVADGGRRGGGCSGSLGGVAGWAVEFRRVYVDVCWLLGGPGWSGRCRVVWWVQGGRSPDITFPCGAGVLWWAFFWGALVVSWGPVHGDGGRVWVFE